LPTVKGEKPFAENDRVYFLQNDRKLDVKNGSLGTIEKINGNELTVKLDRDNQYDRQASQKIIVDLNRYNHIDHGYAATIHKAQGVTVDRTYVLASKYMDSHATYVGMSRHRNSADLFYSREEFANEKALTQTLSRERSKDVSLDYGELRKAFAEHRGIENPTQLENETQPHLQKETAKEPDFKSDIYRELGLDANEVKVFNVDTIREHQAQREVDDFTKFKQQFERENPELSKSLSQELRTEPEKRALAVEKEFERLNKRLEQNPKDYEAKREMTKLATEIFKDKTTMQHLKDRAPELNERIQNLNRERERNLDRGIER